MRSDPIRVLHFLNSPDIPATVKEHVWSLVIFLAPDRIEVTVVCPLRHAMSPLAAPQQYVFTLDSQKLTQGRAMRRLARIPGSQRIDIVRNHQFRPTLFPAPLTKICGLSWVVEMQHVQEAWRHSWLKRSYTIYRAVLTMIDRFIAVSKVNQTRLVKRKQCSPARVSLIYNGRDMNHFRIDGHSRQTGREGYGIASRTSFCSVSDGCSYKKSSYPVDRVQA